MRPTHSTPAWSTQKNVATHRMHVDQPPLLPRPVLHPPKPQLLINLIAQPDPLKLLRKLCPVFFSHWGWSVWPSCSSAGTPTSTSPAKRPSTAKPSVAAIEADSAGGKPKVSTSTTTHQSQEREKEKVERRKARPDLLAVTIACRHAFVTSRFKARIVFPETVRGRVGH